MTILAPATTTTTTTYTTTTTTTTVSTIYSIHAVFSPGKQPLPEPPSAASSQLGRWICQQGLRSARIRGLLLVLAAASAAAVASTTTAAFFTFGHFVLNTVTASAGTEFASHCCMPWNE